jgi:hypothetical protein
MQELARPQIQEALEAALRKLSDIARRFAAKTAESAAHGSAATPTALNSSVTTSLEK